MRESRFWALMEGEFGGRYAHVLADQLVITSLQLTAKQALAAGVPARQVWEELCEQQDVPQERRLGKDNPPKR
ncbi:DUF3046 domain-containing protein [Nesterenkonia alkaliphila]|uniref:DUF3046 domain-containing protein n=1 Tax=Nesterenkonia alkaliphila TaxID=1463631 RepID=A0A7K1UIA4_9MICC|nr:DUF3046 domain-containing protein [Nesterenkonia alkaliphila]MVT26200.1 DUF3046 domain-containing protein [Nesterenkonia alkaliphila]